jgi:hypothetical protein
LCRRCLHNLGVGQIERPHLEQIPSPEAAPETGAEIARQLLDKFFAISGSSPAGLLFFDEASTDGPAGGSHDRVDSAGRCTPRLIEQANDIGQDRIVGAGIGTAGDLGLGARLAFHRLPLLEPMRRFLARGGKCSDCLGADAAAA